jgi:hypothetical protein
LLSAPAINPINNINEVDININTPYTYDLNQPGFGSINIPLYADQATFSTDFPNWISPLTNNMDLRGFYQ